MDVSVIEEQSRDDETSHPAETVGYLAMDPSSFAQDPAEIEVFADSFEVSEWNGLWTEQHRLRGNQDQEAVWHGERVELTDIDHSREYLERSGEARRLRPDPMQDWF